MDQNYNNSQNEFLWTLLAHPADDAQQYNYNLQRLVNDFPQSGILQALLAHSSDEKNLRQASVYFNAKALYKLINSPASLIGVADEKIIVQNGYRSLNYNGYQQQDTNAGTAENYFSDHTGAAVETLTAADELPAAEQEITQPVTDEFAATEAFVGDSFNTAEHITEHTLADDNNAFAYEHHQANENITEVAHEEPVTGPEAGHVAEQTPAHDEPTAETIATETNEEAAHETPLAEPIINYAAGMGHRLPPEEVAEDSHTPPPVPEDHMVEDGAGDSHMPPPVPEEHLVTDYAEEAHTPPPLTEEYSAVEQAEDAHVIQLAAEQHLVTDHTEEAHTPPPVPEEHLAADHTEETHTPPPVPEEHLIVDTAETHTPPPVHDEHLEVGAAATETHMPPPVPEEYEVAEPVVVDYKDFEEPNAEVHQATTDSHPVEEPIEEPIQQYRPWNEPAHEERHEPEVTQQPAPEEYHKPEVKTEEPAVAVYHQAEVKEEAVTHDIDDEVYDEIGSVEPDIISNIAATDYFMFDRAFGEHKNPEPVKEAASATEPVNESAADAEQQDVSKYHDEKMPYSFLWWLDKTRKEHSGIYQPYAAPEETSTVNARARVKAGADELQQQYYENIFHITSVEELDKSLPQPPFAASPSEHMKKEQVIIERFIQDEPQIRPQSSDKLDNENKAKKSSEDRDELVSETLAAIYSDQMLYHKAIASYKKLMLRFPEKSRYFAAKIEQLEKKTN